MIEDKGELRLSVTLDLGLDVDPEELDLQARQLRSELFDLQVESVELWKGSAPPEGTKSAEAVTLGALALGVLPEFLPRLIDALHSWAMRAENRKIKVKTQIGDRSIELEYSPQALSQEQLEHLVGTLTGALAGDTGAV